MFAQPLDHRVQLEHSRPLGLQVFFLIYGHQPK